MPFPYFVSFNRKKNLREIRKTSEHQAEPVMTIAFQGKHRKRFNQNIFSLPKASLLLFPMGLFMAVYSNHY